MTAHVTSRTFCNPAGDERARIISADQVARARRLMSAPLCLDLSEAARSAGTLPRDLDMALWRSMGVRT